MTAKQNDFSGERQQKVGKSVFEIDAIAQGWRPAEVELIGFSIRCPRQDGDDYLVTVRALDSSGQAVVAFHGAYNLGELWIGLASRVNAGTLKWKVDTWER